MLLEHKRVKEFQRKIFSFYQSSGRVLPWRETTDRYAILVSEIMLQQTQVDRVIEKYQDWLEAFPTLEHLAGASFQDVLSLWKGLGYNSRARRLQESAQKIMTYFQGQFPSTPKEMLLLPGVGRYTAHSVLIFADNADYVTVDTNIRRIFIHELGVSPECSEDELYEIASKVLPRGKSRDWHNGLMDYGALVATSRSTGIAAVSKQKPFKGSVREARGKILEYLLAHGTCRSIDLINALQHLHTEKALEGLKKDQLIQEDKEGQIYIVN